MKQQHLMLNFLAALTIAWASLNVAAQETKPFSASFRIQLNGASHLSRGEYDKAIKEFDEVIRLEPDVAWGYKNRGDAWAGKKEHDRAINDYDEAIRLDPRLSAALISRGKAWSEKKEYGKAIKDFDEAVRLDPHHSIALTNRGKFWSDREEYDKAIKDFDDAVHRDPTDTFAFMLRGIVWLDKLEYDKAIKDFDEAIRLNPGVALGFSSRGLAWCAKQEFEKAVKDFDEAIRLAAENSLAPIPSIYFSRSVALMLMRQPKATRGFQAVLMFGGSKGDLAQHAVLLGSFAARHAGDEVRAKEFLSEPVGKPDEVWPYPVIKYLRGEIDEAALLKLATNDDKQTEARSFLGMDLALKGRKDEAIAHFRWVKVRGNRKFIEYVIAVAELDRLERLPEPSTSKR